MKRAVLAFALIWIGTTAARAGVSQFPILGLMGGGTTYIPVQDPPPKSLAAYDFQSLGGPLNDGEKNPYILRMRTSKSPFENCLGAILNCSKLATYDIVGPERPFTNQQNFILVFERPLPIIYKNAKDHVDFISGKRTWRVRYLNETDEDWGVYIQIIVNGKCEATTKYTISGIDGTVPTSKKEDVICGKYAEFRR